MDRSKIVVLAIVAIIIAGVCAWSWVNIFGSPDYDPEKAEEFVDHFYIDCDAEHPEEICTETIGHHHRDCFTDHVETVPDDEIDDRGPVIHDRAGYLDCMHRQLEDRLNDPNR